MSQYKHSLSGIVYKNIIKGYKGNKPLRINNETESKYADRIALSLWARPTMESIEKNRSKFVNIPIYDRHNREGKQYGVVTGIVMDYNKDGTADLKANYDLNDEGLLLHKKYNGKLSLGFKVWDDENGNKQFEYDEISLTPSERIEGCMATSIRNSKYDNIQEVLKINFKFQILNSEKIEDNKMSEQLPVEEKQTIPEKTQETTTQTDNKTTNDNKTQPKNFQFDVSEKDILEVGIKEIKRRENELNEMLRESKKRKLVHYNDDNPEEVNNILSTFNKNYEFTKKSLELSRENDELKSYKENDNKMKDEYNKFKEESLKEIQLLKKKNEEYENQVKLIQKNLPTKSFGDNFQTTRKTLVVNEKEEKHVNDFITNTFLSGGDYVPTSSSTHLKDYNDCMSNFNFKKQKN